MWFVHRKSYWVRQEVIREVRFVKVFTLRRLRRGRFALGGIKIFPEPFTIRPHHEIPNGLTTKFHKLQPVLDRRSHLFLPAWCELFDCLFDSRYSLDLTSLFTIFAVSQEVPLPVAFVPQNVQYQFPYTSFVDTPMVASSTQHAHDTVRGVVQSTYPPSEHAISRYPQTSLASFDCGVRGLLSRSPTT